MPLIVFATCAAHPDVWEDDEPLADALRARGATVEPRVWDAAVEWDDADVVMVRNTWDYFPSRRDELVAWAERVERTTPLHNPADVVRWNTHKGYLRELADAGVPVVPTHWAPPGEPLSLAQLVDERGWGEVVVKPAISAGALDTLRVARADLAVGQQLADRLHSEGQVVMVQPYLESVTGYGERSLVCVDGALSHAARRRPALSDPDRFGAEPAEATEAEAALAQQVLAAIAARFPAQSPLLYARVDVAPDAEGTPLLMEVELTEPQLFLRVAPAPSAAAERLADAVLRRLR